MTIKSKFFYDFIDRPTKCKNFFRIKMFKYFTVVTREHLFNVCKFPKHSIWMHIIGQYNPLVRAMNLVSRTTYVVCVNFTHDWLTPNVKLFWETFQSNFICSQSFWQKSDKSEIVLMTDLGFWHLISRNTTCYTTVTSFFDAWW